MSFRIWLVMLAQLGAPAAFAFPQARTQRPATPRAAYMAQLASYEQSGSVVRAVLKDGTRVLVLETRSQPVVSLLAVFQSGFADEPEGLEGISRLLQHMILMRSSASPTGDLDKDLQAVGGELRAEVDYDRTCYEITVPAPQWKRAMEIQAALLAGPEWSPDEFLRERGRFAEESRRRILAKEDAAYERVLSLAYPDGALARLAGFPSSGADDITHERLREYRRTNYAPGRTLLVIAGDAATSEVLAQVVQLYGKGAKSPAAGRILSRGAGAGGFRYEQARMNIALPMVWIGFRTPGTSSPDYAALEIVGAMLADGEASLLHRRLRDRKKVIYEARGRLLGYADRGLLSLAMLVDAKDVDRCEIAAFTELELLRRAKPDPEEMARAVARLETAYWEGQQTVSQKARALAALELRGEWKSSPGSYPARWRRVKAEDVQRAARRYLGLEEAVLVECLPLGHEERNLTSEGIQELLRGLLESSTAQELAEREKETRPAFEIPEPTAAFKPSELIYDWRKASILRGPDLYVREDHTQPVVYLGFYYAGGRLLESAADSGITALMLHAMLRDTTERSAADVHRQLEIYGGRLTPVVDRDYFGIELAVSSANVEPALDELIGLIKSPKFDAEEIARRKEILLAAIRQRESDVATLMQNETDRLLFGEHAYGLPGPGTEAGVSSLTPEAVRSWYDRTVRYRKPVVVIMGDTRGTSLAEYFVENFSGSRYQDARLPEAFPQAPQKAITSDRTWGGPRTLVAAAFQAPPFGDEGWYPLAVLAEHLAGAAREYVAAVGAKQGRAYSFSVSSDAGLRGGSVTVCSTGPAADTEKLVQALAEVIARRASGEMSYRDFRAARQAAAGRFEIARQLRVQQFRHLVRTVLAGRGLEDFTGWLDRLQEVRQEDLPEVAKRVFDRERAVTVILRGRDDS
jgi:zinc protease